MVCQQCNAVTYQDEKGNRPFFLLRWYFERGYRRWITSPAYFQGIADELMTRPARNPFFVLYGPLKAHPHTLDADHDAQD
jgi:hypothetical protein